MIRALTLLPALCLLVACSEREITIALQPEGGCESPCGRQDISCLEHLQLEVFDDDKDLEVAGNCVDVVATSRSVCEAGLAGTLKLPIPPGADRLAIDGLGPGAASGCAGPPLFVGGAVFSTDQQAVALTVGCTLSCATIAPRTLTLFVDDFIAEGPPTGVTALQMEVGLLIDAETLRYGADGEGSVTPSFHAFDLEMQTPPTTDGWVTLAGESFETVAGPSRCLAVRISGSGRASIACLEVEAEETRVSRLAPPDQERLDDVLRDAGVDTGAGYLVIRARAEDEQPAAGVRAVSLPPGTGVVYGIDNDLASREPLASATTASGLLVIHGAGVGEVVLDPPAGLRETPITVGIVEEHVGALEVLILPSE